MQGLGQQPVPHRQDHLDHTGYPGGGLGVADVRFDRSQQQRPVPVLAVGREQGLGLDRVAQHRAGPVGFHRVHIRCGQSRVGQCLPDHPLLGRAVGGG